MSDPSSTCPDCGAPLPNESPKSLCPSCLLKQAFASNTLEPSSRPSIPSPKPEEIADKFPQFEITECLGRGGMGVVYKARQKSLNRWVAIKILAPERIDDEMFAERFSREAQTLALLNHPNIVTVHDYGETDGLFYIVMEFVDGVNLRDLLHDGKIEASQALTIVPPICEALQYAHEKGIVHRDIKPENLLIDRDGRIKIADFGIASLVGASGEQCGTPPYMAPEQGAQGNVDHRADIYALGVVLYEMLTGNRPASPLDLPSKKVHLDIRIDDIVLRALNKEPERRYRTADEFRTVVEDVTPEAPTPPVEPPAIPAVETTAPEKGMFSRFWWFLILMFPVGAIGGVALGALISYLQPLKYETSTTIQLSPNPPVMGANYPYTEVFDRILSDELLRDTSKQLDLAMRWNVSERASIDMLKALIQAKSIRGTDLVEIGVKGTEPKTTAAIATTLVEALRKRSPSVRILVHEEATVPNQPISHIRKNLLLGGILGFLLSPMAALALMAICHRMIPQRTAKTKVIGEEEASKRALYGKLSLGLFVVGLLGTLAMMTMSHRHDIALVFGAVALILSMIFGLKSGRPFFAVLLVIFAFLAFILAVASIVLFYLKPVRGGPSAEQALKQDRIEEAVQLDTTTRRFEGLRFGPTKDFDLNAPATSDLNYFLNLETGNSVDAPPNIYQLIKHRFNAAVSKPVNADKQIGNWASDSGADLMISMMKPSIGLAIYGGSISFPRFSFEEATPSQVMEQIEILSESTQQAEAGGSPPPFTSFSAPGPDNREAAVFLTRDGNAGILKFIKTTSAPKGVRVRFKMITEKTPDAQASRADFRQVARDHMEAVRKMDPDTAAALWFLPKKLTKQERIQRLQDFEEINQAYEKDPSLMTTFSEWYRIGGYALGRVTPPVGGDGRSLVLMIGHSPQGWGIVEIDDILADESLANKFEEYRESH